MHGRVAADVHIVHVQYERAVPDGVAIDLPTVHVLPGILRIRPLLKLHICKASGQVDSPVDGQICASDLAKGGEDLVHMSACHIASEG